MNAATFAVERIGTATVVHLHGDLRVDQVPDVYEPLSDQIGDEPVLIVDLSDLSYIDSAGIASLIGLYKRVVNDAGGRMALCGAREEIWGVFRTMKLDRLFPPYPDLAGVLKAQGLVDNQLTHD